MAAARHAFACERLQHSKLPPGLTARIAGSRHLQRLLQSNIEVVISRFYQLEEALGSDLATAIVLSDPSVLCFLTETILAYRLELHRFFGSQGVDAVALDDAIAANAVVLHNKPATVAVKLMNASVGIGKPIAQIIETNQSSSHRFCAFLCE